MRISEKTEVFLGQKRRKCGEITKVQFSKSQKLFITEAAYSEHSIAIHYLSMAGYVTAVPAFVCGTSSFCDF